MASVDVDLEETVVVPAVLVRDAVLALARASLETREDVPRSSALFALAEDLDEALPEQWHSDVKALVS